MTYARWRRDGFDVAFVAAKLRKGISALPNGGLRFSGSAFFGDPLILLETGVEFLAPFSDADRSRIINTALQGALRDDGYGPNALIREVNKAARDFSRLPEERYVVATGLSFEHFEDLSRVEPSGCRLYVRRGLPRRMVGARREARERSRRAVRGDYPEDVPFRRYAAAWLHVRGRSASEAMDRAVETLDLRRAIWNYALNRGSGVPFPAPDRGPINEVLAGPLYSLHRADGTLAAETDWFDPEYTEPRLSRNMARKWDRVHADEVGLRNVLRRSPYRTMLEDALRRYCRALDSADLSAAFLNLWALLETLTGIAPNDSHDKVVSRASFIYREDERKTREQVLHHLRRHRNSYVHAGESSGQTGAYLHQLRIYVERMLFFHLQNSSHFSSLEQAVRFLDLPPDTREIRRLIETEERKSKQAAEVSHLAAEGLRFRVEN